MKLIVWIVAGLAVAAYYFYRRRLTARGYGFREVLKNPGLWQRMMAGQREDVEERIAAAAAWDEARIEREVQAYVFGGKSEREAWGQKKVLESLGARMHPPIVTILRDEAGRERLVTADTDNLGPEAPFNRACGLLEEHAPKEALGALEPFARHADDRIRKEVALIVGSMGSLEGVPVMKLLLADSDEYVRSYVLIGLRRAEEKGRLDWRCREALFADLQAMIAADRNGDDAAKLLVKLDAERATAFFLSPEIFRASCPGVGASLRMLAEVGAKVERERVLAVLQELEQGEIDFPRARKIESALELLGRQRDPADRELLAARMNHYEKYIAQGGALGLLASHGLQDFEKTLWEREAASGVESLTRPQRLYLAQLRANGDINNGGIDQFFFNSSGDTWKEAIAGFEVLGCPERARIVREAVAKFGKDEPSADREVRQEQLTRIVRKNDKVFAALNDRYYACKEDVEVAIAQYVIANAEAFR